MKTILVTGADGFIGSHLVEKLISMGFRVRGLVQYNSFNHKGWLEKANSIDNLELVYGDIRDLNFCKSIMVDIDTIFHLAALIGIPYSYVAPQSYVDVNVNGTLNICLAARDIGGIKVVQTSTSEVYGSARFVPINEDHPLQPQSPYSASKIAADAMAMSFHNSFSLPVIVARPFNTYGPRQSARAVIPTIISQMAAGKKLIELGSITTSRDFNFVDDTCGALVALSEAEEAIGKTVNIGSNTEVTIKDLFSLINNLMGSGARISQEKDRFRPEKSEVDRLRCDNSLLVELTSFVPETELEFGLKQTIDWFLNAEKPFDYDAFQYNV